MIEVDDLSRGNLNSLCKGLFCLEIGPFQSPILLGNHVEYFDILTQQELIERIDREGLHRWDLPNYGVPYIHHVEKAGNLSKVNKKYDIVLSSHCIEHQLNFISHLNQVYDLLNDGGLCIIICPDKRYCFDHFRAESGIADVIADFYLDRKRHSLKAFVEYEMIRAHNDPQRHWDGDHGDVASSDSPKNEIEEYVNDITKFKDIHNYKFTPESFKKIINSLKNSNYIKLNLNKIFPTLENTFEFTVILKKD